ncbi:MAG: ATP-binding protein [Verrucomicrobia bacterium]|nr:ATP-binding protein [Verrucomicrobiota bacterium]MBS0637715.1 ATP-binding protein [Verrucomicrobiota bacterium]
MRRTFLDKLVAWKTSPRRKPLIIKGARQVGKTYLLRQFGQMHFPNCHYFNFEKQEELARLFAYNLEPQRIIEELEIYQGRKIDIINDLVVFDEIQACPRALTSLKYFQEDMPQLALASAGSLLGIYLGPVSFPVGKVDFLTLYPMSFEEFLYACEGDRSLKFLTSTERIPELVHDHLWKQLKLYFIVGGMPEVVDIFCTHRAHLFDAFREVRIKQEAILLAYYGDIAKHSGKENAMHIERVLRSIPSQLAQTQDGSARKYSFKDVIPGASRYSRLAGPIDWLQACGLLIKVPIVHTAQVPLMAFAKENDFKLYLFDVGLLGQMSGLDPKVIYEYEYGTFKGYFAENFVAQEFLYSGATQLFSWHEKSAEIEFLRDVEGALIPIEVKSGWVTKSKSLKVFSDRYQPPYRVVFSAKSIAISDDGTLRRYPLYLANKFPFAATA